MTLRRLIALMCCSLFVLSVAVSHGEAFWFRKKKPVEDPAVEQVRTFQPPPENAVTVYCEPYRKEAAELSKKNRLVRFFYGPRRMWLISQHRKCKDELMEQERTYLKHVDIERPPSLPKLKMDAPVTPPGNSHSVPEKQDAAQPD